MQQFLEPTNYVDYQASNIQWELKRFPIKKNNDCQKVKFLFQFVRDTIKSQISPDVINPLKASEVLTHGYGCSIGKANLLAAFCRAEKIPARLSYLELRIHSRENPQSMLRLLASITA